MVLDTSAHGFEWPGMTRLDTKSASDSIQTFQPMVKLPKLIERKIILLATAAITEDNLFLNGLFQNVFFLLRMFDSMGFLPIFIVNEKPKNLEKIPEIIRNCRILSVEDLVKQPIPIFAYIEIGMSIDIMVRKFLKMVGAKIYKLYLGNIINIDVETPVFYPGMNFAHHVIGEIDGVWVSPHYGQHSQYAIALNQLDPRSSTTRTAPYVWDPAVLTDDGRRSLQWHPTQPGETEAFVIMEPNISFQKTALIPLMILEKWFRANPTWDGQVVVVNGERLLQVPFFKESVLANMDLFKQGRINMLGRLDILTTLKSFPNATFVCHQINNEYNYMTLELLWAGFPVLHNAQVWRDFGYSYTGSDLSEAGALIDQIRAHHKDRLEAYKGHARALAWRHSPYNPDIHRAWKEVLRV